MPNTKPPVLIDLDFLPQKYREENARRRAHAARLAVVGLLAGLVLLAGWMQRRTRLALESEMQLVDQQHAAAQARVDRLTELQRQLVERTARAELITLLRHPWPRSQVLAAVVEPLPQAIRLDEIRLAQETNLQRPSPSDRAAPTKKKTDEQPEALDPAKQDLKTLRAEQQDKVLVVLLGGETSDVAALHFYLARLAKHRLIAKAELRSLERANGQDTKSAFRARLLVRTPYGWPGGPTPGAEPATGKLAAHNATQQEVAP